jgi:3-oxoacyl-[acyl-carrier protein] reductase
MDLRLKAKRALACGASKGLGYAVAEALLREGAEVMLNGRKDDSLRAAADRLEASTGRRPVWCVADLTQAQDRQRLYRHTLDAFGGLDLMLVNALGSMTHLCALALPEMRKQRFGRIVQIVSIAGLEVLEGLILSNASRPAVLGFAKALSHEVAPDNVLVNSICPGIFLTDRIRELATQRAAMRTVSEEQALTSMTADIPVGRAGDPAELGDLAAFLLSPRNTYITGAAIPIDGGKTRRLV